MDTRQQAKRLTDPELHALFDRFFPHGFAGADVLAETRQKDGSIHRCWRVSIRLSSSSLTSE
jgi:hypothetical protein